MLGLIVNPVAGIGGAVGLKGSDGPEVQARARQLGGLSAAPARTADALRAFGRSDQPILTVGGAMGEDLCRQLDRMHRVVIRFDGATSGDATRAAARALVDAGAKLILFAGGDGTARDILAGAGPMPILGIPAGVKMYSGVFAASPAQAGRLAANFLAAHPSRVQEVEILDIDEVALRRDEPTLRLHGLATVPVSPSLPRRKASLPSDGDGELAALCAGLARTLDPDCLTIVGPGRTMRLVMAACGLPKTLLGVDAMRGGALVAADCSESQLLALIDHGPAQIVVGLLGAQGCLFGRGNQPISSRILSRVGRDRILALASVEKVASLPRGLFVDTGDPMVDQALTGYLRIHTGPRRSTLLPVRSFSSGGDGLERGSRTSASSS